MQLGKLPEILLHDVFHLNYSIPYGSSFLLLFFVRGVRLVKDVEPVADIALRPPLNFIVHFQDTISLLFVFFEFDPVPINPWKKLFIDVLVKQLLFSIQHNTQDNNHVDVLTLLVTFQRLDQPTQVLNGHFIRGQPPLSEQFVHLVCKIFFAVLHATFSIYLFQQELEAF